MLSVACDLESLVGFLFDFPISIRGSLASSLYKGTVQCHGMENARSASLERLNKNELNVRMHLRAPWHVVDGTFGKGTKSCLR